MPTPASRIGDLAPLYAAHPGLVRVLTAADVPGQNRYGIYPDGQGPAGARRRLRPPSRRGRASRSSGTRQTVAPIVDDGPAHHLGPAARPVVDDGRGRRPRRAVQLHEASPRQRPRPRAGSARGDVDAALADRRSVAAGVVRDHARRARLHRARGRAAPAAIGDRIEVFATTQTPYMDRDELALILGLPATRSRSSRAPAAAGSAASSTCRSSRWSRSRPGSWTGRSGACTPAPNRCARDQAPSRRGSPRRSARTPTGGSPRSTSTATSTPAPTPRGARPSPTACRSTRSGPYVVPAVRATTRALYTNGPIGRRVPRLRRAAGRHRPEALMDDLADELGHRPPGVPPAQRAAGRIDHGDRPGPRRERRSRRLPGRAAARLAAARRTPRPPTPRRRRAH